MDLEALTTGDKVLVGSGIVYLITMFLPWYGISGFGALNRSGWSYFFTGVIPLLLIMAAAAIVLITRFADNVTLPDLPLPLSQVLLIGAGVAAVLVLLRLLFGDDTGLGTDLDRKFGLFLALLAAAGVCAGAFLKMQEGDDSPTHGSTPPQPF